MTITPALNTVVSAPLGFVNRVIVGRICFLWQSLPISSITMPYPDSLVARCEMCELCERFHEPQDFTYFFKPCTGGPGSPEASLWLTCSTSRPFMPEIDGQRLSSTCSEWEGGSRVVGGSKVISRQCI